MPAINAHSGPSTSNESSRRKADAGAFLARVVRLEDDALVRLRRAGPGVELWSWLPLDVLVTRRNTTSRRS